MSRAQQHPAPSPTVLGPPGPGTAHVAQSERRTEVARPDYTTISARHFLVTDEIDLVTDDINRRCHASGRWLEDRFFRLRTEFPLRSFWRRNPGPKLLQSTFTADCVVSKPLKTKRRGFDDSFSPSTSLPIWDVLLPIWTAERGLLRPFVRTTSTGPGADFGPFCVSVGALSLAQPNHARR
jgi:hypothetical protein